ncbi:MAG: glycosyltransferase family 2 protein [Planctomycetota bacterium]
MLPPSTLLAAALAAVAIVGGAVVLPAMGRVRRLRPAERRGPRRAGPTAAVVVAARDEADTIEPALHSLLAQTDDGVRVVVVDDRSTDGTTDILRRVARAHRELEVVRIDALPPGWLGKNHALDRGAKAAGDVDFLLFTDADVVFEPGGVRAAIEHADREGLDHLTGAPRIRARSFALAGMIASFGVLFGLFTRPWRVRDPKSSAAVGIGALNLVRRSAYVAAGGHRRIRMRIDDDLRLGRLIKESGGRSEFVFATDVASLEWYPSLGAMARGLHKNAFAGIDFRLTIALAATVFIVVVFIAPFVLPFLGGLPLAARALAAAAAVAHVAGAAASARRAGLRMDAGLFFPLGLTVFLFVLWRSAVGALATRRVVWRDTAYPLRDLTDAARKEAA